MKRNLLKISNILPLTIFLQAATNKKYEKEYTINLQEQ